MKLEHSSNLPSKWTVAELPQVADVNPRLDKSSVADDLRVSFVPMPAVGAEDGSIDVSETRLFSEVKKGFTHFRQGDVLFAKITPCMENGKMAVVPELENGFGFGSTEFHVLRPATGVFPAFLYFYLSSKGFRLHAEHNMTGAVGQKRVPTQYLKTAEIPLPPTAEQQRIVAKIEELFSELDKGIESLKSAREQLEVYRQAVLKQAFEGKLTEKWRLQHRDSLRSPKKLLEELENLRCKKWDEPNVAFRRGQYRKPTRYDDEDTPCTPDGWALVSMDHLCHHITSGSRGWSKYYDHGSSTFVMAQNVRQGFYDDTFVQRVDPPKGNAETERTRVEINDILVTIVGANTGNVCRFPHCRSDHYVCQSVALMRLVLPAYARFIELYFQSESGGLRQYKRYIYGAGRPHLSFEQLRQTVVPLPDLAEMEEVVRRVDEVFTDLDALESEIDNGLARSEALRQSILKKAFEGRLVPQDPDDEPASVLLERIRAEREAAPKRTRKKRQVA